MPIDFSFRRFKESILLLWFTGRDFGGANNPDTGPFVTPGINVARIADRHLSIRRMQTADMLMSQSMLAPNKYLPKRPVTHNYN